MTPDESVSEAFAALPRTAFLPRDQQRFAPRDHPLPIGWKQTNSQPSTVAKMLSLLDVHPGQRILDVGTGSAWSTALLAHLTGPTGAVLGVEIVPGLVTFGRANLERLGLPWARIEQAEHGLLGLPASAPFDRVLVSAEASTLPAPLVEQLRVGGLMVVPVDGWMLEVRRTDGPPDVTRHDRYSFVPLVDG